MAAALTLAALATACGGEPEPPPNPRIPATTPEQEAAFTAIDAAFRTCGHPIVALPIRDLDVEDGEIEVHPWIEATIEDATLPAVLGELRHCAELLTAATAPLGRLTIGVYLTDPATTRALPPPVATDTPLVAADDDARLRLLRDGGHYRLRRLTVRTDGDALAYDWPAGDRSAANLAVQEAITAWLGDRDAVLGLDAFDRRRLLPGSAHRLRYYQTLCEQRQPSWRCVGPITGVVAATVDIHTLEVTDFRLLDGGPTSPSGLPDPMEPDLTG